MNLLTKAKLNLAARRKNAEADAFLRLETLAQNPDFCKANDLLDGLLFDAAKERATQGTVSAATAQAVAAATQNRLQVLLSCGKTADYLLPRYTCPLCADTGYTNGEPCQCLQAELKRLTGDTGDKPVSDQTDFPQTFVNCNEDEAQNNHNVVEVVKRWSEAFPSVTKNFVTIAGKTGVGKSHLASVVFNRLTAEGYGVIFINAQTLNDLFLSDLLGTGGDRYNTLRDCELLIIDDLGAEPIKQRVTIEYLYATLSARSGLPTLITTNLTIDAIAERYGERVFSRLFDKQNALTMQLKGRDMRLIKR